MEKLGGNFSLDFCVAPVPGAVLWENGNDR